MMPIYPMDDLSETQSNLAELHQETMDKLEMKAKVSILAKAFLWILILDDLFILAVLVKMAWF